MAQRQVKAGALDKVDPVWARIRGEAEDIVRREPVIGDKAVVVELFLSFR